MGYYLHDDPRLPSAWAPWFSHEYITYFSVQSLARVMDLPPVTVKSNPVVHDGTWPLGPNHVDLYRESYREMRRLDPFWSFDYKLRNGDFGTGPPADTSIEPWKVLVIYSTEPDLHPDCDLDLHRFQKFTGGSHGWRHMQIRVLGITFGIAREAFRHHLDQAGKIFSGGNAYWAWRYLSRCTHYLADLGNPFHVKAAPAGVLIRNMFSFSALFKTLSAAHHGYEVYAERRFREGIPAFGEALSGGAREGFTGGGRVFSEMDAYVRRAEGRLKPLFNFFIEEFGQDLIDAFSSLDQGSSMDASAQTNLCSADAARVIFRESHLSALSYLDGITAEILFDVGRMLGTMLAGACP